MITDFTVSKKIKFSVGQGYENVEVGLSVTYNKEDESMTDQEIIDGLTDTCSSYCQAERKKHQSIIADNSAFKGGK